MMLYYAQIDGANRCFSILQTARVISSPSMIPIASMDDSLLGKTWNGSVFV